MNEVWLTQEAYDRLKAELEHRSGEFREEIKARITAAREEQGKIEGRVRQLTKMLEAAQIGTPEIQDGIVSQGMVVTVSFPDLDDTETFLLGSREEAAHTSIDVYSPTSPMGAAVLNQEVGAEISYETPSGKTLRIVIISAELYVP